MSRFFKSIDNTEKKEVQYFPRDQPHSLKKIEELEHENTQSFLDYGQRSNIRNSSPYVPNKFLTFKKQSPFQDTLSKSSPKKVNINTFEVDNNYTSRIMVVGINPENYEIVLKEFKSFGNLEEILFNRDNNFMILRYSSYKEAMIAKDNYNPFCAGQHSRILVSLFHGNELNVYTDNSYKRESVDNTKSLSEIETKSYLRKFLEVFFY